MRKIGVLTSGGDAPGMNAALKTIVKMADKQGCEVIAFKKGFQGLIDNDWRKLTTEDVEMFFSFGGSFIFTGRSKDFLNPEMRNRAVDVYNDHDLDALIVIGGDGSVIGSAELEKMKFNVVLIPATVDNDVFCTDKAIGFDTAVNNAVQYIDNAQQTMRANNRILLVETMGRYCGDISLFVALSSETDVLMIPEQRQDIVKIKREIGKQLKAGNMSPTVVIAEHQVDISALQEEIEREFNHECRALVVGYIQRGGNPTVGDRMLATRMAVKAVESALKGKTGVVASIDDQMQLIPFKKAVLARKVFREDIWNTFIILKRFDTFKKK